MPSRKKRKRCNSIMKESPVKEKIATTSLITKNRFAEIYGLPDGFNNDECSTLKKSRNDVFDRMLEFTELSEHSYKDLCFDEEGDKLIAHVEECSSFLIKTLSEPPIDEVPTGPQQNTLVSDSLVSNNDIAGALLHWSYKGLLQSKSHEHESLETAIRSFKLQHMYWKGLHASLTYFVLLRQQHSGENNLPLTLSVLHKIVPIVLTAAIHANVEDVATRRSVCNEFHLPSIARDVCCILVENFYRPSFDILCDSLLPILATGPTGEISNINSWLQVTASTLRLFRMTKSNPKRSFQTLVRNETFLSLALVHHHFKSFSSLNSVSKESLNQLQTELSDFVLESFFSLKNHMDGFRSLQLQLPMLNLNGSFKSEHQVLCNEKLSEPNTVEKSGYASSFHCYQERLITVLQKYLSSSEFSDSAASLIKPDPTVAVAGFSCLLLAKFLQQTSTLQEQLYEQYKQDIPKKNKKIQKVTELQIHMVFFVTCCLFDGLSAHRREAVHESLLDSVEQNLRLLLEFNIYRPSMDGNDERKFLTSVANEIVVGLTGVQNSSASDELSVCNVDILRSSKERVQGFRILEVLLKLDHLILHERLLEILSWGLTFSVEEFGDDTARIEERDASLILFLSIIETYERLRQLDFLYRSCRESVLRLHRSKNVVRLRHLNMLLNQDDVAARLGSAISMCPFDQVKIVITESNDFVRRLMKEDGSHEILSASISTTVELLAGPVRSVRIDENTHVEIFQVMLDVLHGSVQDLIDSSNNKDGTSSSFYFTHAVTLCSYALESSNHCRFWFVGEQSQQNNLVHYKIPRAIQDALDAAVDRQNNSVGKSLQHEFQSLACQRIRQLHAEMLETESISFAIQQAEDAGHSKISEVRKLAAFVLDSCLDIEEAFHGVFSWWTLADSLPVWAPHVDKAHVDKFLVSLVKILSKGKNDSVRQDETQVPLLHDGSFYEIPAVATRLGLHVISFVGEALSAALTRGRKSKMSLLRFLNPVLRTDWESIPLDSVISHLDRIGVGELVLNDQNKNLLQSSVTVLDIVNSVQAPIWEQCDEPHRALESILRIETVAHAILKTKNIPPMSLLIRLVCHLFSATSRMTVYLLKHNRSYDDCLDLNSPYKAMNHLLRMASVFVDLANEKQKRTLLSSCCSILSSRVKQAFHTDGKFPLESLSVFGHQFVIDDQSSRESRVIVQISCGIAILREIRSYNGRWMGIEQVIREIETTIWREAQECLMSRDFNAGVIWTNSLLLVGEGLRFASTCGKVDDIVLLVEDPLVHKVVEWIGRETTSSVSRSIAYLFSCLRLDRLPHCIKNDVIEAIISSYLDGNLALLTPLCSFVKQLKPSELDAFLEDFRKRTCGLQTLLMIEMYHALLLTITDLDLVAVMSKYSTILLSLCLQFLAAPHPETSIQKASSLIIEISSRRDVGKIQERDIGIILSSVATALENSGSFTENDSPEYPINAYNACYSLVSFFLQRFSKQSQACVTLLVRNLMTMLEFVLYVRLPDIVKLECGQKFNRICELLLLDGDVYKKHVICLIVQFVKGLNDDMYSIRKRSLISGIYCLLEIIQTHESKQLNSMLDEMGRAIMFSVYEGYKKQAYKGH